MISEAFDAVLEARLEILRSHWTIPQVLLAMWPFLLRGLLRSETLVVYAAVADNGLGCALGVTE